MDAVTYIRPGRKNQYTKRRVELDGTYHSITIISSPVFIFVVEHTGRQGDDVVGQVIGEFGVLILSNQNECHNDAGLARYAR